MEPGPFIYLMKTCLLLSYASFIYAMQTFVSCYIYIIPLYQQQANNMLHTYKQISRTKSPEMRLSIYSLHDLG